MLVEQGQPEKEVEVEIEEMKEQELNIMKEQEVSGRKRQVIGHQQVHQYIKVENIGEGLVRQVL